MSTRVTADNGVQLPTSHHLLGNTKYYTKIILYFVQWYILLWEQWYILLWEEDLILYLEFIECNGGDLFQVCNIER